MVIYLEVYLLTYKLIIILAVLIWYVDYIILVTLAIAIYVVEIDKS